MSNPFSQGRAALIEALHADANISGAIKTWYSFEDSVRRRFTFDPAHCPLMGLRPDDAAPDVRYNAGEDIPQGLILFVGTAGADATLSEEMFYRVTQVVKAARRSALGLAGEGLKDVRVGRARWIPLDREDAALIRWRVDIPIEITWTFWNQ